MRNPEFLELLEKVKSTHESKSHDYSKNDNVFSNFEYAAKVSEAFTDPVDRVFATLIGVKLARLAELLSGKTPKNESVDDSFLDGTCYFAIWGSYRAKMAKMASSGFSPLLCKDGNCQYLGFAVKTDHKHSYSK